MALMSVAQGHLRAHALGHEAVPVVHVVGAACIQLGHLPGRNDRAWEMGSEIANTQERERYFRTITVRTFSGHAQSPHCLPLAAFTVEPVTLERSLSAHGVNIFEIFMPELVSR